MAPGKEWRNLRITTPYSCIIYKDCREEIHIRSLRSGWPPHFARAEVVKDQICGAGNDTVANIGELDSLNKELGRRIEEKRIDVPKFQIASVFYRRKRSSNSCAETLKTFHLLAIGH
jgi:hypothetical protein